MDCALPLEISSKLGGTKTIPGADANRRPVEVAYIEVGRNCGETADDHWPLDRRTMLKSRPSPVAIKSPLGIANRLSVRSQSNRPALRSDHVEPFQLAMWRTGTPPASMNTPPAARSPLASVVSVRTSPSPPELVRPEASGCHVTRSHRAMLGAVVPPAVAKRPPATISPVGCANSDSTLPSIPAPYGCQALPSQRAIDRATVPPMLWKSPATTS